MKKSRKTISKMEMLPFGVDIKRAKKMIKEKNQHDESFNNSTRKDQSIDKHSPQKINSIVPGA